MTRHRRTRRGPRRKPRGSEARPSEGAGPRKGPRRRGRRGGRRGRPGQRRIAPRASRSSGRALAARRRARRTRASRHEASSRVAPRSGEERQTARRARPSRERGDFSRANTQSSRREPSRPQRATRRGRSRLLRLQQAPRRRPSNPQSPRVGAGGGDDIKVEAPIGALPSYLHRLSPSPPHCPGALAAATSRMLKACASSPVTLSPHSNANQTMFGKDMLEAAYQPSRPPNGGAVSAALPDLAAYTIEPAMPLLAQSSLNRARRRRSPEPVVGLAAVPLTRRRPMPPGLSAMRRPRR